MQMQTEVDNGNTACVFQSKFCTPPKGAADFKHVITPYDHLSLGITHPGSGRIVINYTNQHNAKVKKILLENIHFHEITSEIQ